MRETHRAGLIYLFLFFGVQTGTVTNGIRCELTPWNPKLEKCPLGLEEIWMERDGDKGNFRRFCCDPNHRDFGLYRSSATNCRRTKCSSFSKTHPTSANNCSTLEGRYVSGSKVRYEAVLYDDSVCSSTSAGSNDKSSWAAAALCCVKDSLEGLYIGLLRAERNEFPFMAKLKLPENCGGMIYNKNFLLTSAHCIVSKETRRLKDTRKMKVVVGTNFGNVDTEANDKGKELILYGVRRVIPHPGYSQLLGNGTRRIFNDIALLELDREIKFGRNVKAVRIAPEGFDPLRWGTEAVILGWGTKETMEVSPYLIKANSKIRKDKDCFMKRNSPYRHGRASKDQLMCLGGIMEGNWSPTAAAGDSGGCGLCRGSDGKAILCGILSFGKNDQNCLNHETEEACPPAVFTEVGYFANWIGSVAGPQDPATLFMPFLYGRKVPAGEYTHQVQILSEDGRSCGGTLIHQDVVITVASCVLKDFARMRRKVEVISDSGQSFGVTKVIPLEGFKLEESADIELQSNPIMSDDFYQNDLAVLKLNGTIQIAPADLPKLSTCKDLKDYNSDGIFAIEVARLRVKGANGERRFLQQRQFKILDDADCQQRLKWIQKSGFNVHFGTDILCGVEQISGGSQCDREVGGGIFCKTRADREVLCGVQVFRLCEWSVPTAFRNIGVFHNWISETVRSL